VIHHPVRGQSIGQAKDEIFGHALSGTLKVGYEPRDELGVLAP
jgi:hypothetical protein